MQAKAIERPAGPIVLIVDDMPENLAVLHDALDEAGFTVLVANNGAAALERARQLVPDIILLDAVMPGMDGFETCRLLRAHMATRAIPVVFMTGLTEAEHVVSAFDAGGTDYVTKPVRQSEVLARIGAHLNTARLMNQARSALDAFGNATLAVSPRDSRIVWQTPLARRLLHKYFAPPETAAHTQTPAPLEAWLAGGAGAPLTIGKASSRLVFSLAGGGSGSEQWMIVLREESDDARVQALMALFGLTRRESEVLHWAMMGKTNRDIGDILGTSPRTVNKHLENLFRKLGVETRTAAAALALNRLRGSLPESAAPCSD
jgi:DNA-binding response OmpR family regulator/DNA-binding CsgD family transcriptional regulator